MSLVEQPPNLADILPKINLSRLAGSVDIQELINRANSHYFYWDKFKYLPLPPNTTHEEVWAYLKMVRMANSKKLNFLDKDGRPFSYWIPDAMLKYLNGIDRSSGEIIGAENFQFLPGQEQYIVSSLMEEAIASSQLEGAATTRRVAKEMLRAGRKPKDRSEQMIVNNWNTMRHLRTNRKMELTPDAIREIHSITTDKTLKNPNSSGQFRQDDEIVVEYNDVVVHTPPKAAVLKERMEALCAFANQGTDHPWIHPVVKATILHFWLGYDHPFEDGNGRTARALFYWYLLSRGYWIFEYLAISRYFLRAPGQYVRAYVYAETDGGDLTYFLNYNLRAIRFALRDVRFYITRKQREVASSNALLRGYRGLNARQKALIFHALRHPDSEYTLGAHKGSHGVAYDTARHDLLSLEKKGFLKRHKEGKAFVFIPSETIMDKLRREPDW